MTYLKRRAVTAFAVAVFSLCASSLLQAQTLRRAMLVKASAFIWSTAASPATAVPGKAAPSTVLRQALPRPKCRSTVLKPSCANLPTTCRLTPRQCYRTRKSQICTPLCSRCRARVRPRTFRVWTIEEIPASGHSLSSEASGRRIVLGKRRSRPTPWVVCERTR